MKLGLATQGGVVLYVWDKESQAPFNFKECWLPQKKLPTKENNISTFRRQASVRQVFHLRMYHQDVCWVMTGNQVHNLPETTCLCLTPEVGDGMLQ